MTEQKDNRKGGDNRGQGRGNNRGRRRRRPQQPKDEFEQRIVDLARVTRVMAGGKRMRFRACVAVGDRKGTVGIGLAKGKDVAMAVNKAVRQAKKNLIKVPLVDNTIPHEVSIKYASAKVLMRPAREGRGLIAGGAVRTVLELAGIPNIVAKMQGSKNKVNNVAAVMEGLKTLRTKEAVERTLQG